MSEPLRYSVVTPARNEAANLRRLAGSMEAQTLAPHEWLIVDDGSTDGTGETAAEIVRELPFATTIARPVDDSSAIRGGPIVVAFEAGVAALEPGYEILVKLDADVSFEADFFARIVAEFEGDPALGITGGTCYEQDASGDWQPTFTTRDHVRGATRAYRAECFRQVTPLERRMGWDGIDELKAQVAGWKTRTLADVPFKHHRPLGAREGSWSRWVGQGDMAHYMGYGFGYLLVRTGYRSLREPSAAGMLWGYVAAVAGRKQRVADEDVRRHLRKQQSLAALPRRAREALGRSRPA
jgi:glycosyltransferase involved in cell wall biosynthesis